MKICLTSIAIIHTPFKKKVGMPIQTAGSIGAKGYVKLKKKFTDGLLDLEQFSHIYLIHCFHKSKGYKLHVIPFLDDKLHGLFSTRATKRPNPIGISVVKLTAVKGNILEIENAAMLDGTPLLDIKPYIPHFDIHNTDKNGWINHATTHPMNVKSDSRFK